MKKYIVQIVLQTIIWTGPKMSPQQAADILRPNSYVYYPIYDGPKVIMINESWAGIPPLDYPTRGLYYGFYQNRTDYYHTTFRGFSSQTKNRFLMLPYKRFYQDNRKRTR